MYVDLHIYIYIYIYIYIVHIYTCMCAYNIYTYYIAQRDTLARGDTPCGPLLALARRPSLASPVGGPPWLPCAWWPSLATWPPFQASWSACHLLLFPICNENDTFEFWNLSISLQICVLGQVSCLPSLPRPRPGRCLL